MAPKCPKTSKMDNYMPTCRRLFSRSVFPRIRRKFPCYCSPYPRGARCFPRLSQSFKVVRLFPIRQFLKFSGPFPSVSRFFLSFFRVFTCRRRQSSGMRSLLLRNDVHQPYFPNLFGPRFRLPTRTRSQHQGIFRRCRIPRHRLYLPCESIRFFRKHQCRICSGRQLPCFRIEI